MNKTSEAKLRANRKSQKINCKVYTMQLSYGTDSDIIDFLDSLPNKQGYLKELIRADLER